MPVNKHGQMITFAVDSGGDYRFDGYARVRVRANQRTCKQIAAHRGNPKQARKIADMNKIRNPRKKLKIGRLLKVPGKLREKFSFSVLAGDTAPVVVSGYPKISVVDRSERTGLSVFTGYDPIVLQIPVRFEIGPAEEGETGRFTSQDGGGQIEDKISELERMAGRGNYKGAAMGPPAIIAVTVTDQQGDRVPLIPIAFQSHHKEANAPLYWISDIDWDPDPIRNNNGKRIRQLATIELTQYVRPKVTMNATERRAARRGGRGRSTSRRDRVGLREDHRAILWVGDSLGVGTVPEAKKHIENSISSNNVVGRSGSATLSVLRSELEPKHGLVVFDAGTNDDPTAVNAMQNLLEDVFKACGDKRDLVIATLNRVESTAAMNTMISRFAQDRKRVYLVNWDQIAANESLIGGDGIHPTTKGYQRRGKLFADRIKATRGR